MQHSALKFLLILTFALASCQSAPTASPRIAPSGLVEVAPLAVEAHLPTATPFPNGTPPLPPPLPLRTVTIAAVGDIMLGREVALTSQRLDDYTWPFHATADQLSAADLTLGNLESVIVENCWIRNRTFILCAKPAAIEGLTYAGFDALSLANNHRFDYNQSGIDESITHLEAAGIAPVIDDRPAIFEVNDMTIGVMGFDDTLQYFEYDRLQPAIADTRARVDVLIAIAHWGFEYVDWPAERQTIVSQQLKAAGVDVIIGSHPHWIQPTIWDDNMLVFYSLGNFVFDQMWSLETRQGHIAYITLTLDHRDNLDIKYTLEPVTIYDFGQPRPETPAQHGQ